jgi:hypothetical protein
MLQLSGAGMTNVCPTGTRIYAAKDRVKLLRGAESMNAAITAHQPEIMKLCREFHVQRLELFGSALHAGFDPEQSDVDLLVEFEPVPPSAYATAFLDFKAAMEQLLGRPVDLVVASAIRNPYFRQSVQHSKALLYAA